MRSADAAAQHRMQRKRPERVDAPLHARSRRWRPARRTCSTASSAACDTPLHIADAVAGAHERVGPIAHVLDRDVAGERTRTCVRTHRGRRQRAPAIEAHQRAHVLRRHQPRRALGFERRAFDPHATAPGLHEDVGRRVRDFGRRAGKRKCARTQRAARGDEPRRPRAAGSGCRGSSATTRTAAAASGRSRRCRSRSARRLRAWRARGRTRSPSSSRDCTSAIQVISLIAGTSRELMETSSRGSPSRGSSAMPQRSRGVKLLK